MQNLSIGKLRRNIRKLERKIRGEKSAGRKFFDVFKKKITSPVGITAAVIGSAVIGWFSFKKIAQKRALKAIQKPTSGSRRKFIPILTSTATIISTLASAAGLLFGSRKSK